MKNNIAKSIILSLIIILLFVIIMIVLISEFFPMNKVIPLKVQEYKTEQSISNEIGTSKTIENKVYEVNNSDLTLYQQSKGYDKEKSDPFGNNNEIVSSNKSKTEKIENKDQKNETTQNTAKSTTDNKKVVTSSVPKNN